MSSLAEGALTSYSGNTDEDLLCLPPRLFRRPWLLHQKVIVERYLCKVVDQAIHIERRKLDRRAQISTRYSHLSGTEECNFPFDFPNFADTIHRGIGKPYNGRASICIIPDKHNSYCIVGLKEPHCAESQTLLIQWRREWRK